MTKITDLQKWVVQDSLNTPEDCALFIQAALLEGEDDPAFIGSVLREVAQSRGMSQTAREAGISREGLYKALAEDGNPSLATILKVLRTFGLRMTVEPIETENAS